MIDLIKIRNWSKYYAKEYNDDAISSEDLAQEVCLRLLKYNYECTNYKLYVKHTFLDMFRTQKRRGKNDTDWYFLYQKDTANPDNLILLKQADKLNREQFPSSRKRTNEFSILADSYDDPDYYRILRFRNFIRDKL